jgi:segregation and condensation protein A
MTDGAGDDRAETDAGPEPLADGGAAGADVSLDITGVETPEPEAAFGGGGDPPEDGADEEDGVEPIELLVRLADRGEIDPWDIDIVAVTEEFLSALDEGDLRAGGRALFYASVLLRMKSEAVMEPEEAEEAEPDPEPWEQALTGTAPADDWAGPDPFENLEREMERRLERKRARGMPQTLDELVRELREAERDSRWKESREYDTSGSPRGFDRGTQTLDYRAIDDVREEGEPTEHDVTATTHGEEMESTIATVYDVLREQYERGRAEVLFAEIDDAAGSRVRTFLAVLFLDHRGQVRLQQDELFGDLWVQEPSADAPDPGSDPVAED